MARQWIPQEAKAAHHLSSVLEIVADRLAAAHSPRAFASALAAHHCLWQEVDRAAALLGWDIPPADMAFALSAAGRDHHLDDHEVEALIDLNRAIARMITGHSLRRQDRHRQGTPVAARLAVPPALLSA